MKKNLIKSVFWCALTMLAFPTMAFAYIDPGAGSIILQGLAAAVVAVTAFWGKIGTKLRDLLNKKDKQK